MYTQERILREIEHEIAEITKNGPANVCNMLDKAETLDAAKQKLGQLQGYVKGLENFKEKVLRWEED